MSDFLSSFGHLRKVGIVSFGWCGFKDSNLARWLRIGEAENHLNIACGIRICIDHGVFVLFGMQTSQSIHIRGRQAFWVACFSSQVHKNLRENGRLGTFGNHDRLACVIMPFPSKGGNSCQHMPLIFVTQNKVFF
jgi:hypothetical protein